MKWSNAHCIFFHIGWLNDTLTIAILAEGLNSQLRLYAVHKTDGFRSRHPGCSSCAPLDAIGSPAHVVSCITSKWRLSSHTVDEGIFSVLPPQNLLGLGSLYQDNGSPALGKPYEKFVRKRAIVKYQSQNVSSDGGDAVLYYFEKSVQF